MTDGVAWLFCPADRPDRFRKAADCADVVILDLEDGVSPGNRTQARNALGSQSLDPRTTVVRVNPVGTSEHELDLMALADTPYTTVMLAKTESADQVAMLAPRRVVALCETPLGILNASQIAVAQNVDNLTWGAEDLIAALKGTSSRTSFGKYRDIARAARSMVLLAAGAAGKPAIDTVYIDIEDLDGLRAEADDAAATGFAAKACIHPSQVPIVQEAYRPAPEAMAWARSVLAAAEIGPGVFRHEGRMIDEPLLRQARQTLARGAHQGE